MKTGFLFVLLMILSGVSVANSQSPTKDSLQHKIMFVSPQNGGDAEIYIMDGHGNNRQPLASGVEPSWSPDGKYITFIATYSDSEATNIYSINVDGTQLHRLVSTSSDKHRPLWSPNGRYIAFRMDNQIYIADSDGRNIRQITNDTTKKRYFSWSPDSTFIVFDIIFPVAQVGIVIADINGNSHRISESGAYPEISPDGQKIVFTTTQNGYDRIDIISVDGKHENSFPGPDSGIIQNTMWSPNGRYIAVVSRISDDKQYIYIMDRDGSIRRLTQNEGSESNPNWSSDGETIIYHLSGKVSGIYLSTLDGKSSVQLTNDEETYGQFWQP